MSVDNEEFKMTKKHQTELTTVAEKIYDFAAETSISQRKSTKRIKWKFSGDLRTLFVSALSRHGKALFESQNACIDS